MNRKIYCDGCSGELQNGDTVFIFENEGYCKECFNAIAEERFSDMSTRELADWLGADVKYIEEE